MSNVTVASWRLYKGAPTEPPDPVVQAAIDAAEEAVGDDCGRAFTVATTASLRRFVAATSSPVLPIDDCTTVTLVTADGSTVASTEYQLEPLNGIDAAGEATPYTAIRLLNGACWPKRGGDAINAITASWGMAALPARYTEAVKIVTSDILDQKDIRGGVAGFGEFGAVSVRDNRMVIKLLSKLRRSKTWGMG